MTPRTTLKHTLAAAVAASALAASPALARPIDFGPADAGSRSQSPTSSLAGTTDGLPKQDLRGERAKDAAHRHLQPGQPSWPVNPQPLPAPTTPAKASTDVDDDGIWLVLGLGLAGAGIVAGGAAGLTRRVRVRARRVAV
jgi:hypothetical protein